MSPRILIALWRLIKTCRGTEQKGRMTGEEQRQIMIDAWHLIKVIRGER
jgi:hypothetical protein